MKNNLTATCITDFKEGDSIYISLTHKGTSKSEMFLCKFVEYNHGRIIGEVEGSGNTIQAHLEKCALYGENPISKNSYYHWFKPSGYAIYPMDFGKQDENSEIINNHPSFGLVGISRRNSRGTALFGSSIRHNEIIALTISKADVERKLSHEWYHALGTVIEIEMSGNQFAELITTPNIGSGVPCTIKRILDKSFPEPPYEDRKTMFSNEFKSKMQNISSGLENTIDVLKEILEKKSVGKSDKEEILKLFKKFQSDISSNIPFVEQSFVEQMDKTITESKAEIESFINRRITEEGKKVLADSFINTDIKYPIEISDEAGQYPIPKKNGE